MTKIKLPAAANTFYTGNSEDLKNQIKSFSYSARAYEYKTRAVIVPHAGLIYSGALAYEGISQLDRNIKTLFIIAPSHRVSFEGLALSSYDEWQTPLGNIKINQEINRELESNFSAKIFDEAHKEEHSIEVEIPIIQTIFKNVQLVPVLYGDINADEIAKIIEKYYPNEDFGFIISSDLSHFLNNEKAKKLDNQTAFMIESGSISGFKYNQACGAIGICALAQFANKLNYSLIRVNMYNSSFLSGDKSRVVGYGAWIMYEGNKNKFIKKYYSKYILNLVRDIISSKFNKNEVITNHDSVFSELGACFVTLKKEGNLRGCIGSIIAHQPLINDIAAHAQDAAFHDPRFNPVSEDEIKDLTIDVSLLSEPKPIYFEDEFDLLNKIVPKKDGIIIKDGSYQAVYLPSVWDEIPDREMFLKSLKMKAGLKPDYFSNTFEAYRFEAEYIEEKSI